MKAQLLVSKWCPTCPQAEEIWKEVSRRVPMDLRILDVTEQESREVASRLRIKTVGVQPLGEARKLLGA